MSALLTTLPGDIPGLLRRGSPFTCDRLSERGEVREVLPTGAAIVADKVRIAVYMLADLALDLTDETGRAHAAWWCRRQPVPWGDLTNWEIDTLSRLGVYAEQGLPFLDSDMNAFARLVLRLAGRTP